VTRYLLDTNVVSETAKRAMTPAVVNWFGNHADDDLFIATLTIAEIWRGIEELPAGRKRRELEECFPGCAGPELFSRDGFSPSTRVRPSNGVGSLLRVDGPDGREVHWI